MPFTTVRAHATALATMATLAKMPVITTASVPQGPNGPLIPEIHDAARMRSTWRARARSTPGTIPSSSLR